MAALLRMVLAVAVITGWVLALTWLALSVSQIAVRSAVTPTLHIPVSHPSEGPS